MKRIVALIFGLSFVSLGCATRTTVRQHPDFEARRHRIKSIVVVPPQVEINRRVAGGDVERLEKETERVVNNLTEIGVKEFSTRGFKVVSGQDALAKDPNLARTSQLAFRELSGAMWDRLPNLESEGKNYRYTLPHDVSSVAVNTSTDAVVFIKFNGFTRSGGDIAGEVASKTLVAVLTAGLVVQFKDPSGAASMAIGLVDGRSGEVLWGNSVVKFYNALTGPEFTMEDLTELLSKLLAQFP